MPLGSAIGSGLGIINEFNIREIVENATVPIIVMQVLEQLVMHHSDGTRM